MHDDERSGRPVTATDNAAVAAVRNVVEADHSVPIDEIMIRLPPGIKIGRSSIGTIMSDVLNFCKVCARWVPRLLWENHKQQRMEAARAFLEMHRRDGDQLFSHIVTGNESWVHHSTPETKRQSMVWKKPEESAPKKVKVTISAGKVMGYRLSGLAAIKLKRPGLLSRKVLLVHDNARPHAARMTQTLLENFKWEIFTHPPYSPDLAPSDFHLFPALKLHLGGKHFVNDDEVQVEANHWLRRQDTAWYNSGIKKLLQRYQKCLDRNVSVNGEGCMSIQMVRRWHSWFLKGRQNKHDDERSGRPFTATDNAAVAAVRNVVEADHSVPIDEIMIRLPPGIKIGRSSIGTIMSDVLNFCKVCARWVPRLLWENHKQQRMEAARAFLEMHRRDGDQLFSHIVTGNESWVHHSTPETKRQSMVWKKPEESAPKKAKVTISAGKVMAIVFWDCKGVLLVDYLPPNTTVNAARYCEVLTKFRAAIKLKRPGLLSRKVLLVHDNARPHAARTTQTLLENFKWEIFTHPPYSPDLAPSDFHLFPALKLHLGGKHFVNDDEVQVEANHWLRRQDTAWYNSGIKKLLQRYQKCLDRNVSRQSACCPDGKFPTEEKPRRWPTMLHRPKPGRRPVGNDMDPFQTDQPSTEGQRRGGLRDEELEVALG
ncbi:hypothetical protein LAZ67_3005901, partial [Cordylochernes scorpioides]